jgi:DNA-binding transcriptional MerR regulator
MAPPDLEGTAFPVNIGQAAALSGISAKMLRHYESLDLLGRVARTDSGYRQYTEADVHTLRFIKRARDLGFSMAEIAELVDLWRNRRRASASVKRIAPAPRGRTGSAHRVHAGHAALAAGPAGQLPRRQPARLPDPGRPGRHAGTTLPLSRGARLAP